MTIRGAEGPARARVGRGRRPRGLSGGTRSRSGTRRRARSALAHDARAAGFVGPPMDLGPYRDRGRPGDPGRGGVGRGRSRTDNGEMVCPPSVRAAVALLASFVIADRFCVAPGLPRRSAPTARLCHDDARALPAGSPPPRSPFARRTLSRRRPSSPWSSATCRPRPTTPTRGSATSDAASTSSSRPSCSRWTSTLSPLLTIGALPILEGARIHGGRARPYVGLIDDRWRSRWRPEHRDPRRALRPARWLFRLLLRIRRQLRERRPPLLRRSTGSGPPCRSSCSQAFPMVREGLVLQRRSPG